MTATATSSPVETTQAIYAAFGRGDLPGLFERLHPDVDWSDTVTAPGAELVPMLHHGIGHAAVRRYFEGVGQLEIHAADRGVTAKTVAHHVQHVYDKIGVRSRAGATLFAVEHRLVR